MGVSRYHLYEQVWARPVRTVAVEYGISGAALARICKRLRVPRPPRGYWAALASGKSIERFPLPDSRPGDELEWLGDDERPRIKRPAVAVPPAKAADIRRHVGKRIATVRRERGLTQLQASKIMGITCRYWAKLEQGTRNLPLDTLTRVANTLEASVSDFFVGITPSSEGMFPRRLIPDPE